MAVRFVIGRAGSGKTHHCLTQIQRRLRDDPIDGPHLIMLVPEQAALQVERTLLAPQDVPGAHRAEVLSFRRLAFRVAQDTDPTGQTALSDTARTMVLRHLLAKNADALKYYRATGVVSGLVDHLSKAITEWIQESVDPTDWKRAIVDGTASTTQRAKWHDLGLMFEAYLGFLGDDRVDPSQVLALARARLAQCAWIHGAEVWVDGFASLAQTELDMLLEMARLCQCVDITLLADPDGDIASSASPCGMDLSVFRKTRRTYVALRKAMGSAGLELLDPLGLNLQPLPRFARSPVLSSVEPALAGGTAKNGRATDPAATPAVADAFRIVALGSRRIEVEFAVAQICALVHRKESPMRYRDVAIIARDLEPYHELLTDAMTARRIPFFIDRRRTIAHHALPELLRTLIELALNDFKLDDVLASLKTGLWPLPQGGVDELENYLLAQGIHGHRRWTTGVWPAIGRSAIQDSRPPKDEVAALGQRIDSHRKALCAVIAPWMAGATDQTGKTAAIWSALIGDALERLGVGAALDRWACDAEKAGRPDEAAEHRQIQRDCQSLFADFSLAFADTPLGLADLHDVLESGLSALTLGLTPPTVDQVLVGSIERSRHPEIKAAIVIGFNDGVFPTYAGEDPMLNDDDRAALIARGLPVRQPARERTLDEPLLAYIAATRASERLTITYATADDDGKALRPSPVIESLRSKLPEVLVEEVTDAELSGEVWDLQTHADLASRVVLDVAARAAPGKDSDAGRALMNRLYEQTRGVLRDDPFSRSVFRSLRATNAAGLSDASRKRIHTGRFRASVSRLEQFAACPFKHFAGTILRLDQRATAALAPVDTGSILHAVLEDFVRHLDGDNPSLQAIQEAHLRERVVQSCARVGDRLHRKRLASQPRDRYRLRRSAAQLVRTLNAQQRIAQETPFAPRAAELAFGFGDPEGLPALELTTPKGRSVQFRGFIDRVDVAEVDGELLGVVIDYKKTSDKRLHLGEVFHGLALQLTAYLLALGAHGDTLAGRPITPIASLYVRLEARRNTVAHPSGVSDREAEFPEAFRPRGLIRFDKFDLLEPPGEEFGWAKHFSIYRKSKGGFGYDNISDAASEADFGLLLAHTKHKLGLLSDGILDGDVAVRPCRHGTYSPCTWCDFKSVCRFEMGMDPVVVLAKMSRTDVLERLQSDTDDLDDADVSGPST